MSRYLLLGLLNLPFVIAGVLNTVVRYKLKQMSKRLLAFKLCCWLLVLAALILAYPLYTFLFSKKLTDTEPMSLFDVIQITGVIGLLYATTRAHSKLDSLERRVQDLHQELSIRLSSPAKQAKK